MPAPERGIFPDINFDNLSPDEQALLQQPTMESLIYAELLVAEREHTLTAHQIADTLEIAEETAIQARADYGEVINPTNIVNKGVNTQTLQTLAQQVIQSEEERQDLAAQDENAQRIATLNYPKLKSAILNAWQNNGGTPIPENLIKLIRTKGQFQSGEQQIYNLAFIVFAGVLTAPEQEEHVEYIEAPTVAKGQVREEVRTEQENVFPNWEAVFLDQTIARDPLAVQKYRNAITQVIRTLPERFGQYGNFEAGESINHLGAIEEIDTLTVKDLNLACKPNAPRTAATAGRILSLVLRMEARLNERDIFVQPSELEEVLNDIRTGIYPPEMQLCEILRDRNQELFSTEEKPTEQIETSQATDEEKRTSRFPTTDQEITDYLVHALNFLYGSTQDKRSGKDFPWPMTTAAIQKMLPRLKQSFIDAMYEKKLVAPEAPAGMPNRSYSKLDVLKLIVLNQFKRGYGVKPREVRKALEKFEDQYDEALNRFKAMQQDQ